MAFKRWLMCCGCAWQAAGPSAEDALNPDAWNTAFFDQFQPPPPSGEQQAAGTYKSPFAASNAQKQGREVGNYWPAEASDPMVYTGKQVPPPDWHPPGWPRLGYGHVCIVTFQAARH